MATETAVATEFLRTVDVEAGELDRLPDGLHRIFRDDLDVLIMRSAFPAATIRHVVDRLRRSDDGFIRVLQEFRDLEREQILFDSDAISDKSVDHEGPTL